MIGIIARALGGSLFGRYLMIGLAALAGVKVWGEVKERAGARGERARRAVDNIKAIRRMQDAGARVATDRAAVAGRLRGGTF